MRLAYTEGHFIAISWTLDKHEGPDISARPLGLSPVSFQLPILAVVIDKRPEPPITVATFWPSGSAIRSTGRRTLLGSWLTLTLLRLGQQPKHGLAQIAVTILLAKNFTYPRGSRVRT